MSIIKKLSPDFKVILRLKPCFMRSADLRSIWSREVAATSVVLLLLFSSSVSNAQITSPDRTLIIAVPNAIPPYAIRELDRGLEIDVVRAVLSQAGYQMSLKYVPLGRLNHILKSRQVDGAMTVKEGLISAAPIYFTKRSHVYYHNVAISLSERNLTIDELEALSMHSIAVFQTPDKFIGSAWTQMREDNNHPIFELSNQKSQVRMLFAGRVDTLVMDINIFNYYRSERREFREAPVTIHEILPKNHVKVAFLEERITKDFDRGLASFISSDTYQTILDKYRSNAMLDH